MSNKDAIKKLNKNVKKNLLDLSDSKQSDKFYLQVGTEPYGQLGTGEKCKVKGCGQPVYDNKSGLCSYHRMMEAESAFEERLRARQQQREAERTG